MKNENNMSVTELKRDFEFYCKSGLVKYSDKWDFYWDVLDIDDDNSNLFKVKFEKMLEMLNNGEEQILKMETDDVYDML